MELHFSENIPGLSYRTMAGPAFEATNSTITGARRMERGKNQKWVVNVRPAGPESVTLTLAPTPDCTSAHAICSASGRAPGERSPNDGARTRHAERRGCTRTRERTTGRSSSRSPLDRAALRTITVAYATRDGSAKAGEDYTASSGTLTFSVGEDSKTVPVELLDDAKDESEETFELVLSNAANALIGDATATGTIENDDPLQRAWLARFGRTVGSQAVRRRRRACHGRCGNARHDRRPVARGGARWRCARTRRSERSRRGHGAVAAGRRRRGGALARAHRARAPARERVLVEQRRRAGRAAGWSAWGRFATSSFDGEEDGVTLSGDVTSAFLGADVASGRWLGGVALGLSEGDGPFTLTGERESTRNNGTVESTLTAVYPYLPAPFRKCA